MTAPPFTVVGLDHLLLHVRGMAKAERFYCGVLGCTVKDRMPQWGMLELSAGVTLVDTADANGAWAIEGTQCGRNLDHFAIATSPWNQATMREWLAQHDVAIEEERARRIRCPSTSAIRPAIWSS